MRSVLVIWGSKHCSCPKESPLCHWQDLAVKKIFAVFRAPLRCVVQCSTGLTKVVSSYCCFIFPAHVPQVGEPTKGWYTMAAPKPRLLSSTYNTLLTQLLHLVRFQYTIHRLRHLRGRFRRALRHCGRNDHFLRQGQIGKLFRRGKIIAHLDLVIYARSASGGRECS
jgi:hypothetical protein